MTRDEFEADIWPMIEDLYPNHKIKGHAIGQWYDSLIKYPVAWIIPEIRGMYRTKSFGTPDLHRLLAAMKQKAREHGLDQYQKRKDTKTTRDDSEWHQIKSKLDAVPDDELDAYRALALAANHELWWMAARPARTKSWMAIVSDQMRSGADPVQRRAVKMRLGYRYDDGGKEKVEVVREVVDITVEQMSQARAWMKEWP